MLRRVLAWILLGGFLFLILNIIVLRFYWQMSMIVYVIIVFWFVLVNRGVNTVSPGNPGGRADGAGGEADESAENKKEGE